MRAVIALSLIWPGILFTVQGQQDQPGSGGVVVTDVSGQEYKLSDAKLTQGTRRLTWLARADGTTEEEKLGPLAVEVREPNSTTLLKGILTLIPAANLESVKYDYEKQIATFALKGRAEPVLGTLEYRGINVLALTGTVDGKPLTLKGGTLSKNAIKSITFPSARALPAPRNTGTFWTVQINQPSAKDPTLSVRNLKVLYQFANGLERLDDHLPVRKADPIPLSGQLKRFELLANDPNTNIAAAEVELQTGASRVIAIPLTTEVEKQPGTLVGLLGEVDAGWKLFPLHTVKVITLTEVKKKID
jgi:hypothetical protein